MKLQLLQICLVLVFVIFIFLSISISQVRLSLLISLILGRKVGCLSRAQQSDTTISDRQ